MATQLRLLENDADTVPTRRPARPVVGRTTPRAKHTKAPFIREPLDAGTRVRGLRGVAAAREALREANQRVAIREAEQRRAKQAGLVELAGRARVIAAQPTGPTPATPHVPDDNAAA